jgi:hypothetical protein
MNVYKKILVKLYEVTGGKGSEAVDFKELVKKEGFYPSYQDILRYLNRQGWIMELGTADKVKITHWGIKEAQKSQTGSVDGTRELKKNANRLKEEIKELLVMSEEFANDVSEENFNAVKNKFDKINVAIEQLKTNL